MMLDALDLFNADRFKEAFPLYKTAADYGNAPSQYVLGIIYYGGLGVDQNYGEAAKWFARAAEQGLKEAKDKLDEMLQGGLISSIPVQPTPPPISSVPPKFTGYGRYMLETGVIFEGEFDKGRRHGMGKFIYKNGSSRDVIFKKGELKD